MTASSVTVTGSPEGFRRDARCSLRLDYLWLLGYGLEDEVPNQSVLSKARRRWGSGSFRAPLRPQRRAMGGSGSCRFDDKAGVITALKTTTGAMDEASELFELEKHERVTASMAKVAVDKDSI